MQRDPGPGKRAGKSVIAAWCGAQGSQYYLGLAQESVLQECLPDSP